MVYRRFGMPLVTATGDTSFCFLRDVVFVRPSSKQPTVVMQLKNFDVSPPLKLSAAWAATVLCYLYCDYFALYVPGKMQAILEGAGPFGPVSQWSLLGAGVLLIVPSTMVLLSIVLPATASRGLSLVFGAAYTLIMGVLAVMASWYFYKVFAVVEAALTATIFWIAWRWPKQDAA